MGTDGGGETRENEENGENKMILEKLLDRDEEEPEVGGFLFFHTIFCVCKSRKAHSEFFPQFF